MNTTLVPVPLRERAGIVRESNELGLKGSCCCHNKMLDFGFICSVCLSLFCSPIPTCLVCGTRFPIPFETGEKENEKEQETSKVGPT
jgi:transcription initiation factor TFIIH subunit 3